jgi:hypothetical protein
MTTTDPIIAAQDEAGEAVERVKFEKTNRRKADWSDEYFKDKSRNKIMIDGVHRGWLSMAMGYGMPWMITTLNNHTAANSVRGKKDSNFVKRAVLRAFKSGNLPTADEMGAHEAAQALEAQRRAEENAKREAAHRQLQAEMAVRRKAEREARTIAVKTLVQMSIDHAFHSDELIAIRLAIRELHGLGID